MYQVASSVLESDSIAYPVRKVFKGKKRFHFRMADVLKVDESSQTILTSIGPIKYDILVIATGADSNFFGIENVKKYSMPMKNLVESLNLRSRILTNFEKALNTTNLEEQEVLMSFLIFGGGPTGVELAELKKQILPKNYPDSDIPLLASMSSAASEKQKSSWRKWTSTYALAHK